LWDYKPLNFYGYAIEEFKLMKQTAMKMRQTAAVAMVVLGGFSLSVPATANDEVIKQGETEFNTYCVACHQPGGIGKPGVAPSLTSPEFLASASDDFLQTTISDGRTGTVMIGWKAVLGDQKIGAVIAYLRSFSNASSRAAKINAEAAAKGNVKLGKKRFAEVCKGCHADQGGGYLSGGNAPAIGKPGFLKVASDGYIREMIRGGRSNTRMRGFSGSTGLANLGDEEIDSIISYLRSLNH
jgi:cbb3-type cytochrome c oxidase subunit III